jgi:hypothetical protein
MSWHRFGSMVCVLAFVITFSFSPRASHAVFMTSATHVIDIDYDDDTLGQAPVQGPNGPPFPMKHPILGGFLDLLTVGTNVTAPDPGLVSHNISFTTSNVAGMTKANLIHNNAPASTTDTSVAYVDHNFVVDSAPWGWLEFDFAQMSAPGGDNAGFRSDFLVVAYRTGGNVAFAIGTRHGTNQVYLQYPGGVNVPVGTYTIGDAQNVKVVIDYAGTGTVDVLLDGVEVATNQAFNNPMTGPEDQIKEFFIQFIAGSGGSNDVALDNFSYMLIPEPASLGLLAGAGMLAVARRRRRSA